MKEWPVLYLLFAAACVAITSAATPGTQLCGVELAAYAPSTLNKIYVAPLLSQGFWVYDRSTIFSVTSHFFTVAANGSTLVSLEIYTDAATNNTATKPGVPVANASFVVEDEVFYADEDVYSGRLQERTFEAAHPQGIVLEPGHYWLVVNQPSSMGWGINVASPRDPSKPVVLTTMYLGDWYSMTKRTAMVQFDGCYIVRPSPSPSSSPSPSRSPSPSPSPSRAPAVIPITANVSAGFSEQEPTINVSAPIISAPSSDGGVAPPPTTTTVKSSFGDIKVGNTSIPVQELGGFEVSRSNDSDSEQSTTVVYKAQLDNSTTLEQSYTFHTKQMEAEFDGMPFTINPSSLKWSVSLTAADSNTVFQSEQVTLQYVLVGVVTGGDGASIPAKGFRVTAKSNSPRVNMTTYVLPLTTSIAAELLVFDVARIDGVLQPIQHKVTLVPLASLNESATAQTDEETAAYVLQLTFPKFNSSLFYDPSLGLGVMLGESGGKGSSSDDGGLVIAVAVVIPLAVFFVIGTILAGFGIIYWRKKRSAENLRRRLSTMHGSSIESKSLKPGDEL